MKKNNDDLATHIRRRANAANISITQLCREAGVPRRWFEDLKRRTPVSVDNYLKLDVRLKEHEQNGADTTESDVSIPQ